MKKKRTWMNSMIASAAVLLSLTMMATGVSAAELGGPDPNAAGTEPAVSWADSIDAMLEGRQYKEGEAMVIYDNSKAQAVSGGQQEEIGTASGEAAEETLDGVNVRNTEDAVSVKLVTNQNKTTRELLEELAQDPAVLSAEPNYIRELPEEETVGMGLTDEGSEKDDKHLKAPILQESAASEIVLKGIRKDFIKEQGYDKVADLSGLQWAYGPTDTYGHYSLHSPNWNTKGGTNVTVPANPKDAPVVAVMDSGIDYEHPDLAPVMVDMSVYDMVIPGKYGKYGYNCSGMGAEDDPMDDNGHGTHCAGIIAAAWDGQGTSGVASGVRLCAVKTSDDKGSFPDACIARAFAYLIEACDKGMNLKSINCSFGGEGTTNTERLLASELGRRGVVTCYASGNSSKDNDKNPTTSSFHINSSSVLVVNAATASCQMSDYTDWGKDTTNLFSPGDAILAPVSKEETRYLPSVDVTKRKSYDTFAPEGSGVQVMYLNTVVAGRDSRISYTKEEFQTLLSNWKEAGSRVNGRESFDGDGYSYKIDAQKQNNPEARAVYLVSIPVNQEDAASISDFGVSVKSTLGKCRVWVRPVTYSEDKVNLALSGSEGWLRPSDVWNSFNVKMNESDNAEGTSYPYFNGRIYLFVMLQDVAATAQRSELYLDCVGGGTDVLRYAFFQGTSMATPAITGSVPVMFDRLEKEGALEGLTKQEKAAKVVTAMKGSTIYGANFNEMTSSNGAFDFDVAKENYTPVISSITKGDNGELKIDGDFFGKDPGCVWFGDQKIDADDDINGSGSQSVKTWTDKAIVVQLSGIKVNGLVNVEVVAANGKKTQRSFNYNIDSGKKLFESEIEMPDAIKDCLIESMIGMDGKVYLLPQTTEVNYPHTIAEEQLWSYDRESDTWTQYKNIPVPELVHQKNLDTSAEINAFGKYVIAHISYKNEQVGENVPKYIDKVYLCNPEINSWTELDFGDLKTPYHYKVFGTDAGIFIAGGSNLVPDNSEETPTYVEKSNNKIYALEIDLAKVEAGDEKATVTKMKESGDIGDQLVNEYASIQSIGDSTIILSKSLLWLKWSGEEAKFTVDGNLEMDFVFESFGKENTPVTYLNSMYNGVNTPFGAAFVGVPANAFTGRGFDSFFVDKDATITAMDKYVSFGDLFGSRACYTDGYLYVWGDSFFNQDNKIGYFAATKLVKDVTPEITLSQDSYVYDGTEKMPEVTVKADGRTLKEREYDVTYEEGRIDPGTYKVGVILKGSYAGSASCDFEITKAPLESAELSYMKKAYTGKPLTPEVKVTAKLGEETVTLKEKTDYTVSYKNNTNAGKATVTVKGCGKFSGTINEAFTITKAANAITEFSPTKKTIKASAVKSKAQSFKLKAKDKLGAKITFAMDKNKTSSKVRKYVTVTKAGKVTVKKGTPAGRYSLKVKVTAAETKNYKSKTATKTVKITVK